MTAPRKTVLLTGGAGAVGKALAADLSADYRLIVVDRNEAALCELHDSCPEVVTYVCDLTSFEAVAATIEEIYNGGHEVDILINNAGTIHSEPLLNPLNRADPRHDLGTWHEIIGNNLHSVFYVTTCIAEKMVSLRTRGVIINVSSISATGNPGQSAYGAAKAAVNALTKTWNRELAPLGIRVAGVAPGFLDVASTHGALPKRYIEKWIRQTPAGRLGMPREMTQAMRFIIENDYFSGRILELDGGLTI